MASPASEFKTRWTPAPRVICPDFVRERGGTRIHDMTDAQPPEIISLFVTAGRRKYFRARQLCNLNRRQSDAAGRGMDEDFFATLNPPEVVQRVPGGHERDGNRGSLRRRQARGLADDKRRRHGQMRGKATRAVGNHFVAGFEICDAAADGMTRPQHSSPSNRSSSWFSG